MGAFNGTCHLSGIGISEDEKVIFVPVQYSYITNTTTQCYSTDCSAHIAGLPFETTYNDYGSVKDVNNEILLKPFLNDVNRGLLNNKQFDSKKGLFLGNTYGLIKRENFPNDFARIEFLSDSAILGKIKDRNNLHEIQKLENNDALINVLSENQLFSVSGDIVSRYGYLLIKSSFFEKILDTGYRDKMNNIKNNIHSFILTPLEGDEIINGRFVNDFNLSKEHFERNILGLFNDNHTFNYEQFKLIKSLRAHYFSNDYESKDEFNEKLSKVAYALSQQAIISIIYADIGKTFYPNAAPLRDHKALYNYANILREEIGALNQANLDSYSVENGYDEETQKRHQWLTPTRF